MFQGVDVFHLQRPRKTGLEFDLGADARFGSGGRSSGGCFRHKKAGSCPEVSVQRAVADGLENVVFSEVIGAAQVSEGAGDFENAVVGAGAEVHLAHRMLELRGGGSVQGAVLFDEARRHGAVGVNARMFGETLALHASRCFDAFADV